MKRWTGNIHRRILWVIDEGGQIIAKLLLLSLEENEDELLNAIISVLDGFENKTQMTKENFCTKLVFEGMEIDVSRRMLYRGKKEVKVTSVEF